MRFLDDRNLTLSGPCQMEAWEYQTLVLCRQIEIILYDLLPLPPDSVESVVRWAMGLFLSTSPLNLEVESWQQDEKPGVGEIFWVSCDPGPWEISEILGRETPCLEVRRKHNFILEVVKFQNRFIAYETLISQVKKPGIRNWGREGKKRKAPRGSAV
jgi:hypothetical protein